MSQVVLILVGLIGSGKVCILGYDPSICFPFLLREQSTFARALEKHLPASFRRCNQDDLGNRRRVEELARQTLQLGLSVCIDRTNFDAQ